MPGSNPWFSSVFPPRPVTDGQSPRVSISERKMAENQEDKQRPAASIVALRRPASSSGGVKPVYGHCADDAWYTVPAAFRAGAVLPAPWEEVFGPLRHGAVDDLMVVGQVGQSLDGRIATVSGHRIISTAPMAGASASAAALVDAVVIGIGTVLADDPQLTVRRVSVRIRHAWSSIRVDACRLTRPARRRCRASGGDAGETSVRVPSGVACVKLPADNGHIAPATCSPAWRRAAIAAS